MKRIFTIIILCTMMTMLVSCTTKVNETMNSNSVKPTETVTPMVTAQPTVTTAPTVAPTASPTPTAVVEDIDYTNKKLVALTFDDGPNVITTPKVLDKLEAHHVVASFFLIGKNITPETKKVMERQLQLGCEIDNHSWSHSYMNQLTQEEIKDEIQKTSDLINTMVGVTPKFFRPPYIATSPEMYENIDLPFICGIGCNDWEPAVTAQKRAETILSNVKDGDIILLHDAAGNQNTVDALDDIIQGLLDEGYAFVTVSKLFELKGVEPNVENVIWTNTNQ